MTGVAPSGTTTPPSGAAPYEKLGSAAQRNTLRDLGNLLRSDLFKRTGSDAENRSAIWTGPLGWAVQYGYMADDERVWCRIFQPSGDVLVETLDGDAFWLERELP